MMNQSFFPPAMDNRSSKPALDSAHPSNELALKLFLHRNRLLEKSYLGLDKFWEDQFPSKMEDWTNHPIANSQGLDLHHLATQSCHSPSAASESSSSLSTQESSSFSGRSEMLHSPDVLSAGFSRFSIFNSEFNHSEILPKQTLRNDRTGLSCKLFNENVNDRSRLEYSGPLHHVFDDAPVKVGHGASVLATDDTHAGEYCLGEDCLSDSDESWVSASSVWELPYEGDNEPNEIHSPVKDTRPLEVGGFPVFVRDEHSIHDKVEYHKHGLQLGHTLVESPKPQIGWSKANSGDSKDEKKACNMSVLHKIHELDSLHNNANCISSFPASADLSSSNNIPDSSIICKPSRKPGTPSIQESGPSGRPTGSMLGFSSVSEPALLYSGARISCGPKVHIKDDSRCQLSQKEAKIMKKQSVTPVEPVLMSTYPQAAHSRHSKTTHSAAVRDRFPSSSIQGHLRFAEQDGSPCYSFSLDNTDEVYFARACKHDRQSRKTKFDWMYTFHCRRENGKSKNAWKSWTKKETQSSDLLGKMRVCNNETRETRFILFDDKRHQVSSSQAIGHNEIQDQLSFWSTDSILDSGSLPPKTPDRGMNRNIKRRQHGESHIGNTALQHGLGYAKNTEAVKDSIKEHWKIIKPRKTELAAIVITTSVVKDKPTKDTSRKPSEEEVSGWGVTFLEKGLRSGWGMKFLDKSSTSGGNSPQPSFAQRNGSHSAQQSAEYIDTRMLKNLGSSQQKPYLSISENIEKKLGIIISNQSKTKKIGVTVILPAGDHGFPRDGGAGDHLQGPTPLLERWKSGGVCDCGGWDMGCGLSVMKSDTLKLNDKQPSIALTNHDRMTWFMPGKPLKILTQGCNPNAALVLETIQAGLFSLSFQARFSPLQAFATAVAMFHQQMTQE